MNQISLWATLDYILDNIDIVYNVKILVESIKNELIDLVFDHSISESEFYKISSILTPQCRSPLWENYFIRKYGCEKISKDLNNGDFKKDGKYYEYKCSGYNQTNTLNIIQIRPWQNCDYIIQFIYNDEPITFILTHDEMILEMDIMKASCAHGTPDAIKNNDNVEYKITLKKDSIDWYRWIDKYNKLLEFLVIQ